MRNISAAPLLALALCAPLAAETPSGQDALYSTIMELDSAAFDAFNHCADPQQLQRHAGYFDSAVEFYHDTGGVTWSRQEMLANTEQYVCGKFRRERVEDSLKVFPIKDFGAIAQGTHRFCQFGSDRCEGLAEFTMVWQQQEDGWRITRVLSYGHRANPQAQ